MKRLYTIGHSTHSIEEFIEILSNFGIEQLVDIRTVPRSRHVPQFEKDSLEKSLPESGIEYIHLKKLGGLRPKAKDSMNGAWKNASFRNYADYMQTEEFESGLEELIDLADTRKVAIMCAEAVPWRCHRSLVGDAMTVHGFEVVDIMSLKSAKPHSLTKFAVVDGKKVTYPATGGSEER